MYEHILLDERAAIDVDMDGLVAHELAHQWFGDLVTCRDFSEGWLNEGWATYMELVWKDEGTEPGAGRDEYDYALKGELEIYVDEDQSRYRRPIVSRDYEAPIDLFDRHLYQKGALVLHRIRRLVGDGPFWRGVRRYLEAHAHGIVETRDLQRAIEAESGKSLDRTLDLYVYGPGHPSLEVRVDVEAEGGRTAVVVSISQTQALDDPTRLYEGPIVVEISEGGRVRREERELRSAKDTLIFAVERRPDWIAVDPDGDLLATLDVTAPADLCRAQLEHGSRPRVRWMAAEALAKRDDPKTIAALARALRRDDEFWGVRAEAATALGQLRTDASLEVLLGAVGVKHAKVRRAVARALGKARSPKAVAPLKALALTDPSYLVASEAARALGANRQIEAFDTLVELLDRKSWADSVKSGAADGLALLRDERAVPHLVARSAYGHDSHGRRSCLIALARLDGTRKTRELCEERLDDKDPFVRMAAVRALDVLGDVKARAALARRLEREDAGNIRRRIKEALRDLRGAHGVEIRALRDELDKVRDEAKDLRARLVKLEARFAAPEPEEGRGAKKAPAPARQRETKRPRASRKRSKKG
jgi:aminopeptidase N